MRRFKKIIYIFYFIFIAITVLIGFFPEIVVNNFSFNQIIFTLLPIWAISIAIIMLVEWLAENAHIVRLKNRIRELEKLNTALKAKMFDQEEVLKSTKTGSGTIPPAENPKGLNKDTE